MISIKEWIRENRHKIEAEIGTSERRRFYSPGYYSQYDVTLRLINSFVKGKLIDLGCGSMPYRQFIADKVTAYDGLEFYPSTPEVTYVGDIQNMSMIESDSYDSAICLEVLEHVTDPFRAMGEIYRILKNSGILVLSLPHLNRLHMEPHDYYRFTHYGMRHLLESAGFKVIALEKRGGLFSFLGHQVSTFFLGMVWSVPILKNIAWFLNSWLVTRLWYNIDRFFDPTGIYAMGYTAVACKGECEN